VQGEFDENKLKIQLDDTDIVFLYNGNHELYLYDAGKNQCISWTHEELTYRLDTDPYAFAAKLTNYFFIKRRAVYGWDPFNLKTIEHHYNNILIFIRDLAFASTNIWLTKKMIKDLVKSERDITTPEFMKYLSHMPDIYTTVEQEDYLMRFVAGEVEQLYSNAKIFFLRDKLLAKIKQGNKSGADTRTASNIYNTLNSDDMVQIPYMSRDKITGRMFPRRGAFNPITETDQIVLTAIGSRHDGAIVMFDFASFEPTIIEHVLKIPMTNDIHQRSADVLQTSRINAKKLNNMILYGASERALLVELKIHEISPASRDRYLQMMRPIINGVNEVDKLLKAEFTRQGFIRNALGRIVRPRSQNTVFNNFIQATASDLFNAASMHVFDLLREKQSKLFMHKFDAIYVDVHPKETEIIEDIVNIMANKTGVLFTVKVFAGRDLGNLKILQ
jgi:hypothetical protein